ncbi:hypothetical protein [Wolbachia endosymbiont of Psylliodes chrysocephala]|uniref:hypothetical protein n=1 Tax=Wolbachia endosymbiont of Psylliodes chrysocephala TaxID=2883236 RepID=UPI00209D341D|nr:hypothetical protein [Wolbachia endosymbiont of Psylliodes chrysocephala]
MRRNCDSSVICSINSLTLVWLNSKWLHEFIVNYYQYKVRCNKAIPVSATRMTSSFFWDSSVKHWDDIIGALE